MTAEALIDLLSHASPVYVPTASLPADAVREAIAAGLASEWEDSPAGPALLLSSLACEQRGLTLDDEKDIGASRWVAIGQWKPAVCFDPTLPDEFDQAAPGPGPLATLIASEARLHRWDPDAPDEGYIAPAEPGQRHGSVMTGCNAPVPVLILGTGRPLWTPAIEAPASPCPVCQGRELAENAACLACLRSGIDLMLPEVLESEKPRPGRCQDLDTLDGWTGQARPGFSKSGKRLGRPPGRTTARRRKGGKARAKATDRPR